MKLEGFVTEGFELVQKHLESMLASGCEDNVQLCVYVGKKCVINLYGSYNDHAQYDENSLQCVFSSGKSVAAIVIAQMVGKGLLDYNEKVHKYWPQFAQNGKDEITLADVLRHESGLAWLDHTFGKEDFFTENIKANIPGEIFEKEPLHFPISGGLQDTDTKREYHYISRGCILNEIVRRVDPNGRTIGEIIRDDPNFEGIRVGLTDDELKQCVPESSLSNRKILRQSLLPKVLGRGIEQNFKDFVDMKKKGKRVAAKSSGRPPFMDGMGIELHRAAEIIVDPQIKKSELPSATTHASAKALAKLAAMMANDGDGLVKGQDLLSKGAWTSMHANPKRAYDAAMYNNRTNFTQGGVNIVTLEEDSTPEEMVTAEGRVGFIGWSGLGGSIFQWHPELKIGFAFVPSCLHWFDFANLRGAKLQKLVLECVKKQRTI